MCLYASSISFTVTHTARFVFSINKIALRAPKGMGYWLCWHLLIDFIAILEYVGRKFDMRSHTCCAFISFSPKCGQAVFKS